MAKRSGKKFSLSRNAILRGKKNFDALFTTGNTLHGRYVNMRFRIFDTANPECKVAFVAAKRLGNAVKRNTMKRRMREAYRLHQHILTDEVSRSGVGLHGAFMIKKCGQPYKNIERDMISFSNTLAKMIKNTREDR